MRFCRFLIERSRWTAFLRLAFLYKILYIEGVENKPVVWMGSSIDAVRAFPAIARKRAGYELYRLEQGLDPSDWKPIPTVGLGVREIRIQAGAAFRILYVARFAEAVYVLHAFEKRTRKTRQADVQLAKKRLAEVMRLRESR
jgi:phage-related protein